MWPTRVCAAEQGIVFRVSSVDRNNISQFSVLSSFWTESV